MQDAAAEPLMIRRWGAGDRDTVSELLRLLSSTAEVTTDDTATYVAVTGDQVVGMVTLCVFRTLTGPKAHLDHLVVAPDARRRGIGRALVEHAMTQAQAAGASRIDLTAHERKRAGHALYEALGFRRRDTTAFRLWL